MATLHLSPSSCEAKVEEAIRRFQARNPKSLEHHEAAIDSMPGGNTRTLLHTAPFPVVMVCGEGTKLYDLDGHEYLDFVGELTAGLYGHSSPKIKKAMTGVLSDIGLSLGATNIYEKKYADLLCSRFDLDSLRFANSGTEANIHALAAAREFTGKRKVVVFRGGYHGSVLAFGLGIAPNNVDPHDWILSQYNDPDALNEVFNTHDDIAAVLVEGMQGSGGGIPASRKFLRAIREQTLKAAAVFILDEVMTSRLHPGGMAATIEEKPDLKTLGKYLGGGMPFGAFGGRKDIMAVYDPRKQGSLSHSGTFQNNTLMLNAGYTGLAEVFTPDVAIQFNKNGDNFRAELLDIFEGTKFTVTGVGSLMCIHCTKPGLTSAQIRAKDDYAPHEDVDLKKLFWLEMMEAGFWIHQRGSIALNLAMEANAMEAFVQAVKAFCSRHHKLVHFPGQNIE
ncbi:aminotransferase [Penicillium angulare]|uniref:aminotransferase n=1 Tax=Penicillium angulare TaxID=116970 RepID=UPI00253FA465|nr:aminotransferase [Penicillium angulare]KAJ5289208.1 aminotransferase [Penicillium angulare]